MSPVSRRRPGAGRRAPVAQALRANEARKVRAENPLDALTSRIGKLDVHADGFAAEAVVSWVLEVVGSRGPDADEVVARFCRAAVTDERAGSTVAGLQAMSVLALHGHPGVRSEAAQLLAHADAGLRAELPSWVEHVGQVQVVETGVLSSADGTESVLHLLLDHVHPDAGPRHLVSLAVHHGDTRVHLLDVRARQDDDRLAPMAEKYVGSVDPVWSWGGAEAVRAAAVPALRVTAEHTPAQWPVLGVEGAETLTWTLGVHRLGVAAGQDLLQP
jgi:hypothetical protein